MASDLIYREDAKNFVRHAYHKGLNPVEYIDGVPAADVVEVVRCRDCYAYQRDKELAEAAYLEPEQYCALLRCEFGPDGFCSYGRRADNG